MSDPIVTRRLSEALQILKTDPTGFVGAHQLWVAQHQFDDPPPCGRRADSLGEAFV